MFLNFFPCVYIDCMNELKISVHIFIISPLFLKKTTVAVLDNFEIDGVWLVAPLELDKGKMCACDEEYSLTDMTAYQMIARKNLKVNL